MYIPRPSAFVSIRSTLRNQTYNAQPSPNSSNCGHGNGGMLKRKSSFARASAATIAASSGSPLGRVRRISWASRHASLLSRLPPRFLPRFRCFRTRFRTGGSTYAGGTCCGLEWRFGRVHNVLNDERVAAVPACVGHPVQGADLAADGGGGVEQGGQAPRQGAGRIGARGRGWPSSREGSSGQTCHRAVDRGPSVVRRPPWGRRGRSASGLTKSRQSLPVGRQITAGRHGSASLTRRSVASSWFVRVL